MLFSSLKSKCTAVYSTDSAIVLLNCNDKKNIPPEMNEMNLLTLFPPLNVRVYQYFFCRLKSKDVNVFPEALKEN